MTENIENLNGEVSRWFALMSTSAKVEKIDNRHLRDYLKKLGAKDVKDEDIQTLSAYLPGKASGGLIAVLGEEKYKSFTPFLTNWVQKFDSKSENRDLQKTKPSNEIGTGMKRFLLETVQFAYGILGFEEYKDRTEKALVNGVLWQQFKDDHMIKKSTPEHKDPIKVASIAPGFILDFVNWLENSKTNA